jgi:hypothetical protein
VQPRVDLRAASQEYWALESDAAVEAFATSPFGLSPDEAARRLKETGENDHADGYLT